MRGPIGLALLVLLAGAAAVAPATAADKCAVYEENCYGAAENQYYMCRASGGTHPECWEQFKWFYNSCMEGTGCPFVPH